MGFDVFFDDEAISLVLRSKSNVLLDFDVPRSGARSIACLTGYFSKCVLPILLFKVEFNGVLKKNIRHVGSCSYEN
jgi:hypothetical protein